MLAEVTFLVFGFISGLTAAYFMAKNNKKKAVELINTDVDDLAKKILDSTEIDDQLINFVRMLKVRLDKMK